MSGWTSHEEESWDYMSQEQEQQSPVEEKEVEHFHKWIIIDTWNSTEEPYHPRIAATATTLVLVRCEVCHLPQTVELKGRWTIEQILGNHAQIQKPEHE